MVRRFFTEKRQGFRHAADALLAELNTYFNISGLRNVRVVMRYDIEGLDGEFVDTVKSSVLSEPACDECAEALDASGACAVFATEYLPGQFDQRADSAAQCISLLTMKQKPVVRCATVYLLYGSVTDKELDAIKKHMINPVDSREADLREYDTLSPKRAEIKPVETISGFTTLDDAGIDALRRKMGLAMDAADVKFCQAHFRSEHREPTVTEIAVIDTYWSDHCRHTTFNTIIENAEFEDADAQVEYENYLRLHAEVSPKKPVTLMDMATIAAKKLKRDGILTKLDESDEINACTVKTTVLVDGKPEEYLVLFKNETHNHPTEIEPFGGAATCIGGAIRDPLSGRGYVYQAMRVTGAGDPTGSLDATMPGKLSQKRIVTGAARGYSSYGNQIGLATGLVDEIYDEGYTAKHMEIGAVVGAVKRDAVVRETPAPGDAVILIGGRTGRDGCGGATGASKQHDAASQETCGAQVQKGNAPEERKLQRLFMLPEAVRMIKRCNDFGAGGVSVAIGELADGLMISLDAVPRKYDGLDGTELAISESQERMAVVVADSDAERMMALARGENLEATVVARVTEEPRLVMEYMGQRVADIPRAFLDTNGAQKRMSARVEAKKPAAAKSGKDFAVRARETMRDLNVCDKRGLIEMFDPTIGARTLMLPYGGKYLATRAQVMAARLPVAGETNACTAMSYGFDPAASKKSPFDGAYGAVVESVAKLVAAGATLDECYLTFQEYFPSIMGEPSRMGKPLAAMLGALRAQLELKLAAIGGKDSMSGTYEGAGDAPMDVPPTLVSFAIAIADKARLISPEFKRAGSRVALVRAKRGEVRGTFDKVAALIRDGYVTAASTPVRGGAFAAVVNMCAGSRVGFGFDAGVTADELFCDAPGAFVLELAENAPETGILLGKTEKNPDICYNGETIKLDELLSISASRLEGVYPTKADAGEACVERATYAASKRKVCGLRTAKPRVLIPVFPGTNCELDSAAAFIRAGAVAETFVVNTLDAAACERSAAELARALNNSQILFIPGGFSGGDEPDGSGKFIAAFFKNPRITDAIGELINSRDGLVGGICNGFQALIKLGLVPYGELRSGEAGSPTLVVNSIGRHAARMVNVRVASNKSPWLMYCSPDEVETLPISHGEGRFVCDDALYRRLLENGQIATQYCAADGTLSMDVNVNPNGSYQAVEGITSPDGRIFGRMAHAERCLGDLYINLQPRVTESSMFRAAADYFGR